MSDAKPHDPAAACPVDHKSREAWMQQARAASSSSSSTTSAPLPPDHPRIPTAAAGADAEESCPVDHKAREAWMQQARAASASSSPSPAAPPQQQQQQPQQTSWTSGILSYLPFGSSSSSTTAAVQHHLQQQVPEQSRLGTSRIVSSIPRSGLLPTGEGEAGQQGTQHMPANKEQETGADEASGNWIYPSEKMFFDAMKRKGHDPQAPDMRTIVPIHNAVNERAWAEIKQWEAPFYQKGSSCEGPRLSSFSGLSSKLSPKAKINTWLGYQAPFDRHDWVVDRCGQEIEYIIDFYTGRPRGDGKPSFYLDVRPKLNSWEGVKMRALRGLGIQ